MEKPTMWFPNRSDTNRPVQLQKQARSLKFWSQVEEELYYPSSEKQRPLFSPRQIVGFPMRRLIWFLGKRLQMMYSDRQAVILTRLLFLLNRLISSSKLFIESLILKNNPTVTIGVPHYTHSSDSTHARNVKI